MTNTSYIPSSSLPPITLPSYPKFLNYAWFEPLVVGIQENLVCPPLLPINLDGDGRVGTSFLQVGCPDPQGPREFCRDRSSCPIKISRVKNFHVISGEKKQVKGVQDWRADHAQVWPILRNPLYQVPILGTQGVLAIWKRVSQWSS